MDAAHRGSVAFAERDPVQARGELATNEPAEVHAAATAGVRGGGSALPHFDRIQTAFGAHDLGGVQAHVGGAAADASERIGAEAYTTGEHVAFRGAPDLHTAAHEAAHVVQQRAGVALAGGVGQAGDAYERHADAVADRVVRGESAADLLDQRASSDAGAGAATPGVQRQASPDAGTPAPREEAQHEAGVVPSSADERLARVRSLVGQGWAGPFDEAEIERIWDSFGPRVLEVAEQHRALWDECIDRGAKLDELPSVRAAQQRFRADVRALARALLERNQAHVQAEMMAIGTDEDGGANPAGSPMPEDMQENHLVELGERAADLLAARQALAALRKVPVGFRAVDGNHASRWEPATFDPAGPPPHGPTSQLVLAHVREQHQMRTWDEVLQHHQRLTQVVAMLAGTSPALYATVAREDDDRLADVAAGEPDEARRALGKSLSELLANIRATIPKLASGDLDDRDLTPLHQRLLAGERGASGTDWSRPLHRRAVEDMLSEHARGQFWLSLGLGTLAAAAFVVAELSTMGTATFFAAAGVGLGAGGALAGRGWEQWEDLDTAAGASTSQGGQIVTREQADAAFTSAVIDSALAFLDLVPAVRVATTTRRGLPAVARPGAELAPAGRVEQAAPGTLAGSLDEAAPGAPATRDVDAAVEPGARQGAGAGMEQAGARTDQDATLGLRADEATRLRPQEAGNWRELLQGYIGRKLVDVDVPPGYTAHEQNGRTVLRRVVRDDARFARLHVDGEGVIRAGRPTTPRLGDAERAKESIGRILASRGLTGRPAGHQMHHIVPDEVVRKHPLMRMAYERGLFDPDAPENLALLARRTDDNGAPPAKIAGLSEGLPTHQGPHRQYSLAVTKAADRVMRELAPGGGDLAKVSDERLLKAALEVRARAWELLREWKGSHLQ